MFEARVAELEALVGALEEQNARAVELAEAVSFAVKHGAIQVG